MARYKKPYIRKLGKRGDITIWIVDGAFIRKNLDEEFNNMGQHYRFDFIPEAEFWIESESNHDESRFFIDHLLVEYNLMKKGMPYNKALTLAEKAEKKERHRAAYRSNMHHKFLGMGHAKPDPASVHDRLWKKLGSGIKVYIVNGKKVRDWFDIEFTEGGHHEVYDYVPEGEVWIDDAITPKERPFILLHEMHELKLMEKGVKYEKAHEECSNLEEYYRHHPGNLKSALAAEEAISQKD
jgi:hypothetical protein